MSNMDLAAQAKNLYESGLITEKAYQKILLKGNKKKRETENYQFKVMKQVNDFQSNLKTRHQKLNREDMKYEYQNYLNEKAVREKRMRKLEKEMTLHQNW